jgi:hypothetical protein
VRLGYAAGHSPAVQVQVRTLNALHAHQGAFALILPGLCVALCFATPQVEASPAASSPPPTFTVSWRPDPRATNQWTAEARGFPPATWRALRQARWTEADWQKLFPVVAGSEDPLADLQLPAMLGSYRLDEGAVQFTPRFPMQPGIHYRAVLHPARLPDASPSLSPVSSSMRIPAGRVVSSTFVARIYPSADDLPENLLKFYLLFSAPMSGGSIYDHIHLRDELGKAVELPFLEIDEELWNPDMTRLTLFIDPGRIKRGVTPLEEVGPALSTGRRYSLVIDADWRDARGASLTKPYQKSFRVIPPDRTPIDFKQWKITSPAAQSTGSLEVRFDRPMDFALAQRVIGVRRPSGERLEGSVALKDQERTWTFTPARPWKAGAYELVIQTTLEDLAGNNIGKSFEVDLFESVQRKVSHTVERLPFEVKK